MERTKVLCRLTVALVVTVAVPFFVRAEGPPADIPLELLMEQEAVTTPAPAAVPEELEDQLGEEVQMATVCTEKCPGSLLFGIPPYTPNCYNTCTPCYENGRICGFLCDGYGLLCFPVGCTNPSC